MNCAAARDHLDDRLDGVIQSADAAALDRHLEQCASCARVAAQLQAMDTAWSTLAEVVVPPPAPSRVVGRPWLMRRVMAAAAIVLALFVIRESWTPHPDIVSIDPPSAPPSVLDIRMVGQSAADYLPLVRSDVVPRVHVVWLYPTARVSAAESSH